MAIDNVVSLYKESNTFSFEKKQNQLLLIKGIRVLFLIAILMAFLAIQGFQTHFIPVNVILPVYILLTISFLANGIYLSFFDYFHTRWVFNAAIFAYDTLCITGLIYFTGTNHTAFLFLYLANIVLAGLVHQRNGGYTLALWTSILFSCLLIVSPELHEQNLSLIVVVNNFAFFVVGGLSGILSEQIQFMGTELKARSKDLEALQELNQMIIENVSTGLITLDLKFKIVHANRAASKVLQRGQLVGKTMREVFTNFKEQIQDSLNFEHRDSVNRIEVEQLNSKSEKQIIEVMISPLFDAARRRKGFVLLIQDLTRIKNLEFAMRQKEKLAAVGQLAAGIAHEIRNPLASISGSIQMLETSFSDTNEESKKLMNITIREIDRLNNLITEFLEFVRPETLNGEPININNVVKEMLDIVRVNDRLRKDTDQKLMLNSHKIILGDYNKLKQALLNIIINAYQAMESTDGPVITVQTYDKESRVVLEIKDNGVGMDAENLSKIFEPFHTTKASGTGLGLAITHKILETHNAKVFVDSEKAKGTVFTIEFPSANDSHQDELAEKKRA